MRILTEYVGSRSGTRERHRCVRSCRTGGACVAHAEHPARTPAAGGLQSVRVRWWPRRGIKPSRSMTGLKPRHDSSRVVAKGLPIYSETSPPSLESEASPFRWTGRAKRDKAAVWQPGGGRTSSSPL